MYFTYIEGSWKQSLPSFKLLANNTQVYGTTGVTERNVALLIGSKRKSRKKKTKRNKREIRNGKRSKTINRMRKIPQSSQQLMDRRQVKWKSD